MKTSLVIFFLHFALLAHGQDLKVLERALRETVVSDTMQIRILADSIFTIDPYNDVATVCMTSHYYNDRPVNVSAFFQKMKKLDSNNPKPYILNAKYHPYTYSVADTITRSEFAIAISLDSNNFEANYLMGRSFYFSFNKEPSYYYAYWSRRYFLKVIQLDSSYLPTLKYPIIQASNFLNDTVSVSWLFNTHQQIHCDKDHVPREGEGYFPYTLFLDLNPGWEHNYSVDLMHAVDMATFRQERYSGKLHAMREPVICDQKDRTVYRFLWLRSFHAPVAIRFEKKDNGYMLYWKTLSRENEDAPWTIDISRSKKVSERKWNKFMSLLKSANFWEMPSKEDRFGLDGSEWIIEGLDKNVYHMVDRWHPSKTPFGECGLYLIKLAGLTEKLY